ncbi:MAG TPA: hypothetical protein VNA25_00605 [Phycisphaerae bacterium]|nr:hypothetical protein [Phycisphaerae bacterium]
MRPGMIQGCLLVSLVLLSGCSPAQPPAPDSQGEVSRKGAETDVLVVFRRTDWDDDGRETCSGAKVSVQPGRPFLVTHLIGDEEITLSGTIRRVEEGVWHVDLVYTGRSPTFTFRSESTGSVATGDVNMLHSSFSHLSTPSYDMIILERTPADRADRKPRLR